MKIYFYGKNKEEARKKCSNWWNTIDPSRIAEIKSISVLIKNTATYAVYFTEVVFKLPKYVPK